MINLEMIPLKKGIIVGEKNTLEILIRASGSSKYQPELHKRLPLNLSLVIDRSGSMQGRPLEEAKKSAIMLIDRMDETDQLSVVTYDNQVDVVFPTTKVTNKPLLKSLITGITQGGMTALFDGWSVGADLVSLHSDDAYFSRVLLLSDGQANQGLTDPKIISSSCQVMAEKGVLREEHRAPAWDSQITTSAMRNSRCLRRAWRLEQQHLKSEEKLGEGKGGSPRSLRL